MVMLLLVYNLYQGWCDTDSHFSPVKILNKFPLDLVVLGSRFMLLPFLHPQKNEKMYTTTPKKVNAIAGFPKVTVLSTTYWASSFIIFHFLVSLGCSYLVKTGNKPFCEAVKMVIRISIQQVRKFSVLLRHIQTC